MRDRSSMAAWAGVAVRLLILVLPIDDTSGTASEGTTGERSGVLGAVRDAQDEASSAASDAKRAASVLDDVEVSVGLMSAKPHDFWVRVAAC